MQETVVGILGTGDMGSAVGAIFRRQGYRVVTDSSGRSPTSRELATRAGLEDLGSLDAVLIESDLLLSILPPAIAFDFAERAAERINALGTELIFADCNAVAPATITAIAAQFDACPARFVDVGIVGPAPRPATPSPTRFYVSGAARSAVVEIELPEIAMIDMGDQIGRASAIKMVYAALNKGTDALLTAVLLAAERLGVRAELVREFESSQPNAADRIAKRVPYLAATAARYTGEMREIADTFATVGITRGFHEGAEWLYTQLAASELAGETRATRPAGRSLDEAIAAFVRVLPDG